MKQIKLLFFGLALGLALFGSKQGLAQSKTKQGPPLPSAHKDLFYVVLNIEDPFSPWQVLHKGKNILPQAADSLHIEASGLMRVWLGPQLNYYLWRDSLLTLPYQAINSQNPRIWVVKQGSYYGLVSAQGQGLAPLRYDTLRWLQQEQAYLACRDTACGLLDSMGQTLLPMQYRQIQAFGQGYWLQDLQGRAYWQNQKQQSEIFDQGFSPFSQGLLAVQRKGLWGLINDQGQTLLPCQFAEIQILSPQTFRLRENQDQATNEVFHQLKAQFTLDQIQNTLGLSWGFALQHQNTWTLYNDQAQALAQNLDSLQQHKDYLLLHQGQNISLYGPQAQLMLGPIPAQSAQFLGDYLLYLNENSSELLPLQDKAQPHRYTQILSLRHPHLFWVCQGSNCGILNAKDNKIITSLYPQYLETGGFGDLYRCSDHKTKDLKIKWFWHSIYLD